MYEVRSSVKERRCFLGESSRYEIVNLESGKKIRIWKYCYVILSIYINAFDICVHAFIVR